MPVPEGSPDLQGFENLEGLENTAREGCWIMLLNNSTRCNRAVARQQVFFIQALVQLLKMKAFFTPF
jgi:hypothetical protein